MKIPDNFSKDADALPSSLRKLLDAEIAAGNKIIEVGHTFPAPPAGAYFKLSNPVTTRPHESGEGIDFYDRDSTYYSGEFTDAKRFFFILEPPHPTSPEPDMDAIRVAHSPKSLFTQQTNSSPTSPESPALRFERSMKIDYEKWHDGIGYDLEALRECSPKEKQLIEEKLAKKSPLDWRDIEALAELGTPLSIETLQRAKSDSNPEICMAVIRFAPNLVTDAERTASILSSLKIAKPYEGLTQTLDQVEEFHPKEVIDGLLHGSLEREGEVAEQFAAMLFFIFGKSSDPFDWDHRPFFLRFNTEYAEDRRKAFRELCGIIGVKPEKYVSE